jgi:predicted unusual protein kinase regulating ubiquinone biosynthesis (AarF/ABC1/UbiB family)
LPEEYVQTMKPLRSNAPEMSLEDVYTVIREDLKIEVININRFVVKCYRL